MQLIFLSAAFAATPVVYDGDAAAAVRAVSEATGVPQWELRPVGIAELFPGEDPLVVGVGQPQGCTGAATNNSAVRDLVTAAEKKLNRQEYSEMRERLAVAAAALPCLAEPAEASLLGRLYFLDGYAAGEVGDSQGAASAFRRARASQPALAWDDRLVQGASRPAFDAVVSAAAPEGQLLLGPGFEGVPTLWVDGRLMTVEKGSLKLGEGEHLVQVLQPSVSTWVVKLKPKNPVALVKAGDARQRAMVGASDENGRAVIEAASERALESDAELYVWTGSALWHGGANWESIVLKSAVPVAKPRSPALGSALLGAGAALTVVGGVGAITGWTEAGAHFAAIEGESDETYELRNAWYRSSVTLGTASSVVAGVGVLGVVAGALLLPHPTENTAFMVAPAVGGGALLVSGGF